jgi:hypothetical protein
MLGSAHHQAFASGGVTMRVIWFLVIVLLGLVILETVLKRPAAVTEAPTSFQSYQHLGLLSGPAPAESLTASFQSRVRDTSSRVTFLVNVALLSYLVFGCILIPLTWLLLFRQPRSQRSAENDRGQSAE